VCGSVLGRKGRKSAKGGVGREGNECVCWEERVRGEGKAPKGCVRERRRQQGMCVGVGQGMGRGAEH
jgi:hypothetical protein